MGNAENEMALRIYREIPRLYVGGIVTFNLIKSRAQVEASGFLRSVESATNCRAGGLRKPAKRKP